MPTGEVVVMSFEGKKTWIDLEHELMRDLGIQEDEEDNNAKESDFINDVETIPHPHGDGENASVLNTNSGGASDGEDDNDGTNTPQIYPLHQSQPPITGDFQQGDQNENQAHFAGESDTAESEIADIDRSQPVAEQLINMEAIQIALNNDVDEILSENVVSASVLKDNEGENAQDDEENDTGNNTHHDEIRPGAHHIYPSQPSTGDDSQEDDASDVVYELFDRPASPLLAEVIPEAVPVDLDVVSCDYRANVKSAAVVSLH